MKVSIIGAGRVGASSAFHILTEYFPDELVLVDVVPNLAEGQAMDLTHAARILDLPVSVTGSTSMSAIKGSDVVVVTAGKPRKANMDRMELLHTNAKIITSIAKDIKRYAPNAIVVTTTNPVDVMNYIMWKKTGFSRRRVIGVGSLLDTARLNALGYDGFVMGQHGEYFTPIVDDKHFKLAISMVDKANRKVIAYKGGTEFGPAVQVSEIVGTILEDTKDEIPLSVVLGGEYGLRGVSIGVLSILGSSGVEAIYEINLSKKQRARFMKGALAVKMGIDAVLGKPKKPSKGVKKKPSKKKAKGRLSKKKATKKATKKKTTKKTGKAAKRKKTVNKRSKKKVVAKKAVRKKTAKKRPTKKVRKSNALKKKKKGKKSKRRKK